jgi:hypothetical protein
MNLLAVVVAQRPGNALVLSHVQFLTPFGYLITQLAPRWSLWGHRVVHRYQLVHRPQRDPVQKGLSLPAFQRLYGSEEQCEAIGEGALAQWVPLSPLQWP